MTCAQPAEHLATAIRVGAAGLHALEAACELLVSTRWLHRDDFTSQFITVYPGIGSGPQAAVIDWPAVIAAVGSRLPCSGGEQRILKITASLAGGIPVDLRDTITGLDDRNVQLLLTAIRRASGRRPQHEPVSSSACRIGFQLPGEETTK